MKIEVTERHINLGNRGKCRSCPVAIALEEAYGFRVFVDYEIVYKDLGKGKSSVLGYIPSEISDIIVNYDNTTIMKPFSFELL